MDATSKKEGGDDDDDDEEEETILSFLHADFSLGANISGFESMNMGVKE